VAPLVLGFLLPGALLVKLALGAAMRSSVRAISS
jgi:hypothetical protein